MKFLRNVNGFSLIEGMVAAAVLAVGVSAITLYIVQSTRNTVALQGDSLCQTRSQMIIQTFKNGDNKANISNWVYSGGSSLVPTLTAPYHHEIAMFGIVVNTAAPSTSPMPITLPTFTNGWELIDSGTNWALSLAKSSTQYCQLTGNQWGKALGTTTASFGIYSGQQLAPPPSTLTNETDYLNIQLVDRTVNPPVYSCPGGYFRVEPLSFQNQGDLTAGANLSVQVTGTVVYTDNNQIQRQCQSITTLKPGGDSTPPSFKSPLGPAPLLMTNTPATVYCGAGTGVGNGLMCVKGTKIIPAASPAPAIACNSATDLEVAFQSNEAGSIFGCDLEYATTKAALPGAVNFNKTYVCGQGSYNVGGGGLAATTSLHVTPFLGPATSGSGEMVTLSSAPDGFYRLFVTIYDSAQNYTTQSIDFGVDNSRPGAGFSVVPPTPFISSFNGVGAPARGHLPVAAPWNTAVSFGTDLFQCQNSLATDTWSVTGGETVPVAIEGAVWSYTKNGGPSIPLSGVNCVPTMRSPAGLVDGTYVMKGYACDACGIAAPTPAPVTQTWYVDEAPAPTTGHNPVAAPGSDFGTAGVPFPSWSLSVAKPVPDLYQYACQNYLPNATFSSQVSTCTPTGFAGGQPCTSQGSKGFSTIAFDGCGRNASDTNTPYEIMASFGQSCCNVPCRTDINLICSMDNSASRGTCVNKVTCALDSDCGAGAVCFLPMGVCHGGASGPAPQTCGVVVPTPTPVATATPAGTPVATPVPSATPTPTPGPTPSGGIPGLCGTANGRAYRAGPSANHCAQGISTVPVPTGGPDGPWNWTCQGSPPGPPLDAYCSAYFTQDGSQGSCPSCGIGSPCFTTNFFEWSSSCSTSGPGPTNPNYTYLISGYSGAGFNAIGSPGECCCYEETQSGGTAIAAGCPANSGGTMTGGLPSGTQCAVYVSSWSGSCGTGACFQAFNDPTSTSAPASSTSSCYQSSYVDGQPGIPGTCDQCVLGYSNGSPQAFSLGGCNINYSYVKCN